jgi:hypothetical protein
MQVTGRGVGVIACGTGQNVASWSPASHHTITLASAHSSTVLVACASEVTLIDAQNGALTVIAYVCLFAIQLEIVHSWFMVTHTGK